MKLTEIEKEEKVHQISVMLAAAYWRGRISELERELNPELFENTIKHAAETDAPRWRSAAQIFD